MNRLMEVAVMNKSNTCATLSFAPLLEKYFLKYLINQKKATPRTVSTYRDSFSIYLTYLDSIRGIAPDKIEMVHFSLDYLEAFCSYLENVRGCSSSTINLRLSSIKSFLRFAAIEAPEYSEIIRRALSLPNRKTEKAIVSYITKSEYESLLAACNGSDMISARDKMMLMIMYNTGCRVSELTGLTVADVALSGDSGTSSIRFYGKGRKERITPIWKSTACYISKYICSQGLSLNDHLFRNSRNEYLTRSGVGQRVTSIVAKAALTCPSLKEKSISPHTFRHSTAMNLLQAGVDISTIAIWLGHESIETTHKYMVADIETKRRAMEKLNPTGDTSFLYKPSKSILDFLNTL